MAKTEPRSYRVALTAHGVDLDDGRQFAPGDTFDLDEKQRKANRALIDSDQIIDTTHAED